MKTIPLAALVLFSALFFSSGQLQAAETIADRIKKVQAALAPKRSEGKAAYFAELEKHAREMVKDFPDAEEPYEALFAVAQNSDDEKKADAIIQELSANEKTPAAVKARIKGVQAQKEALGKPLDIKFTALDGRAVDLAAMKGKVVLVDFWATWCGPCVAEIPSVKKTYDALHAKGFEIVGISFDQEKGELEKFVKEKELPWPQYFDGEGWKNKFGQQYGIDSIPRMWLVDKSGNLADMNGREDLEKKVTALLAK